jgi:RNA polymerase sigma-70 factor (ECF subfamily)
MSRDDDRAATATREHLAATFQAHRAHLFGMAYRMLGSAADAEDVLQEAYLRWQSAPRDDVAAPRSFLATIVARLCIDTLTAARAKRETYVGPWLPEPVDTKTVEPLDVASLSLAFLVVLEALTPLERAAFLMREVFDYELTEIAEALGREESAVRKLVQRARAHVAEHRPRFAPTREAHARLIEAFVRAVAAGDPAQVEALLVDEVRATADGGGRLPTARKAVIGREAVARYVVGLAKRGMVGAIRIADINGALAILIHHEDKALGVVELETDGTRIFAINVIVNPEKLSHVGGHAGEESPPTV